MAGTPETNDLLMQLMQILEKNRSERQGSEEQRLNASSGFAQGLAGGLANKKDAPAAAEKAEPVVKAGGETESPRPRVAQRYIDAQRPPGDVGQRGPGDPTFQANSDGRDETGYLKHHNKMYRDDMNDGLGPMSPNYRAHSYGSAVRPENRAIAEELVKRQTQAQGGSALGGAGTPPPSNMPTTAGVDPAVVNAVSGAGGPVPQMNPQAQPMPTPAAAQGLPQPDYALLDWAAERQARGM